MDAPSVPRSRARARGDACYRPLDAREIALLAPPRLPLLALAAALLAGCPAEPQTPSDADLARGRIVVGGPGAAAGPDVRPDERYLYLVKRGAVVVGLADQRRMGLDVAREATRKVADVFEACLAEQIPRGAPAKGAARAAVKMTDDGTVLGVAVSVDDANDGPEVSVALRCLKAPIALMAFPPADADAGTGDRGFAVEAAW